MLSMLPAAELAEDVETGGLKVEAVEANEAIAKIRVKTNLKGPNGQHPSMLMDHHLDHVLIITLMAVKLFIVQIL